MGKWFSLGGFHGTPPLCTNGSAGYLMQLSVKDTHRDVPQNMPLCQVHYGRFRDFKDCENCSFCSCNIWTSKQSWYVVGNIGVPKVNNILQKLNPEIELDSNSILCRSCYKCTHQSGPKTIDSVILFLETYI